MMFNNLKKCVSYLNKINRISNQKYVHQNKKILNKLPYHHDIKGIKFNQYYNINRYLSSNRYVKTYDAYDVLDIDKSSTPTQKEILSFPCWPPLQSGSK